MPAAIGLATVASVPSGRMSTHSVFNGKLEIIVIAIHSSPHYICG